MKTFNKVSRRSFLAGSAAGAGLLALPGSRAFAQAAYPSENFRVVIPTGQGGAAERVARPFADAWTEILGVNFEFEFFPGAAGQIGYELFIKQREHNGYNLLYGNMGPEMIMYATQKPDYKFPEDFIYFCRTDVDDSCIFVRKESEFTDIKQVGEAAKQRTLNVAVSRIPHPASIGVLALGEQTGAKFTLIPYGGGNPTYTAVMSGETDIGALPLAGTLALTDQFRILGIFNDTGNPYPDRTDNAPLINATFGTTIPELYSSKSWAIHRDWADANPEEFKKLEETSKQALASPKFRDAYAKTGAPIESIVYGDKDVCTEYALAMIELAKKYEKILSADKG